MLFHTCARGSGVCSPYAPPKRNDTNDAIWCILSVPKCVINLNIKNFRIINQQSKFCAIIFSKINPDAHVSTKINTFTFYKANALRSQRNVKKMEAFPF